MQCMATCVRNTVLLYFVNVQQAFTVLRCKMKGGPGVSGMRILVVFSDVLFEVFRTFVWHIGHGIPYILDDLKIASPAALGEAAVSGVVILRSLGVCGL